MRRMWRFILESFIRYTYITYRSKRVRPRRFIPPCWTWAELSSAFFFARSLFTKSPDAARLALHGLARAHPRRAAPVALVAGHEVARGAFSLFSPLDFRANVS